MSWLEKLRAFGRALWKALGKYPQFLIALRTGKEVPFEVALARLKVCNSCDRLEPISRQCQECFCFVGVKVRWDNQTCPLGKWEKHDLNRLDQP